jgi:hypothetical protein
MFTPPHPDQVRHAAALLRDGWRPEASVRPNEILATVSRRDYRQHVERETWAVLHLMAALPVRGDVKAGNPSIRLITPAPSADVPSGNGVLTRVRGSFVAEAAASLPPARDVAAAAPPAQVTIEVPDLGLVQITFTVNTYRHGRSRHWHWRAVRADLVQPC